MHQIGLKLWSTNENYFNEAKRLFEEGFYEYIELYAVPDSLRFIDLWKKLRVPYIVHAPHYGNGLNLADNEKKSNNLRLAAQAIRFADELSAEYIIFHPGINGNIEETACQLKQIRDSRRLIENKPHFSLDREICVGSRPEEIEYLMKQCGIGCCLDIGHAICAANSHKMDHMAFLKEFIALKPSVCHFTDGDSNSQLDSHKHLGQGNYNLAKLIKVIDRNSYLTLETEKNSQKNLNDFVEDVLYLRKLGEYFVVRKALQSDLINVYDLSNNPAIRMQSISKDKIELDDHKKWFNAKLQSDQDLFYIVETFDGRFAGQVRFDLRENRKWLISISLHEAFRGKGLACDIIRKSSRMAHAVCNVPVVAYIKVENEASRRAFLNARYELKDEELLKDQPYYRLEL